MGSAPHPNECIWLPGAHVCFAGAEGIVAFPGRSCFLESRNDNGVLLQAPWIFEDTAPPTCVASRAVVGFRSAIADPWNDPMAPWSTTAKL